MANAEQTLNQSRQFVAEQNALINQNNLKRKEDKDAKLSQDSLLGDFNYAKDSVSDLYAGTGVQQAISSRNARLKRNQLKAENMKKTALAGKSEAEYGETQVKKAYASQPKVMLSPEAQAQFDAQREQIRASLPKPLPPVGSAVSDDPDEITRRLARLRGDDEPPLDLGGKSLDQAQADLEKQMAPEKPPQIETPTTSNVSQATPDTDDTPRLTEPPAGSKPTPTTVEAPVEAPEETSLLTRGIKSATGLSEETSELAGRIGGGLAGATMGGLSLYDDIANKEKTGHFFNPKDSGADDFSNVTNIIAGASDVVGLIPGLEWVAGLGNAVGGIGGVVKMFGDHDKNVSQQQTDQDSYKPTANVGQSISTTTGRIDQTAQSNLRQPTTSMGVY